MKLQSLPFSTKLTLKSCQKILQDLSAGSFGRPWKLQNPWKSRNNPAGIVKESGANELKLPILEQESWKILKDRQCDPTVDWCRFLISEYNSLIKQLMNIQELRYRLRSTVDLFQLVHRSFDPCDPLGFKANRHRFTKIFRIFQDFSGFFRFFDEFPGILSSCRGIFD